MKQISNFNRIQAEMEEIEKEFELLQSQKRGIETRLNELKGAYNVCEKILNTWVNEAVEVKPAAEVTQAGKSKPVKLT